MAAIRTNDGRLVDPLKPTPADVRPRVMIHSLSQINRFTGQCNWPYPVAQHEINLYKLVPARLRKAALTHDLGESWFNDLASPVKAEYDGYREDEEYAKVFISAHLGVSLEELHELDWWDKNIYINERNALFSHIGETGMGDERQGIPDVPTHFFAERNWRDVRRELSSLFISEFGKEVFER